MSLSIRFGNFLFHHCFSLYKPLYSAFKRKQDAFEIELLKTHIGKGDTVADIGANIGFYAELISELVGPKGNVHCFEPDPVNFSHLEKRVKHLRNVTANQCAIGPKTEMLNVYTSPDLNVDHRTYRPEAFESIVSVPAISLDDYVERNNIESLKLIKMDIQGFEFQALQGMRNTIRRFPNVVLITEFWPYGLRLAGHNCSEFISELMSLGFRCHLLEGNELRALNTENSSAMKDLPKEKYFNILARRADA